MASTSPPRHCRRCGRPIDTANGAYSCFEDGGELVFQHIVCPISVELGQLRPLNADPAVLAAAHNAPAPAWLTIAEAAQLLRVSKSTIRLRIRNGLLPAKRLLGGQTVLIARPDLLDLLQDARAAV